MQKTLSKAAILSVVILGSSIFLSGSVASADTNSSTSENRMEMDGGMRDMMDKNHDAVMKFLGIYGGKVTVVSGTTLTIELKDKTTMTVNAASATALRDGKDAAISTIVVGDMLMIKGDLSGTTITASKIAAMSAPKKMDSTMKKIMKDGIKDMKKGMKKEMKDKKKELKNTNTSTSTTSTTTTN